MKSVRLAGILLVLTGALTGCATSGAPGFGTSTITLRVVNESGARIAVSAIWAGGSPVFVGEVQNRRENSFSVSYTRAARLQALVEFADGGQARSNRLTPRPEETIELRVGVDRIPELTPVDDEKGGT